MSKPLSRRLFGKIMAAAPLASQSLAAGTAAKLATAETMKAVGMGVAPEVHGFGSYVFSNARLLALWKAGLAPDWAMREFDDEVRERARRLTPDVAALRSVSLSGKLAINAERTRRSMIDNIESAALRDAARRMFWNEENKR